MRKLNHCCENDLLFYSIKIKNMKNCQRKEVNQKYKQNKTIKTKTELNKVAHFKILPNHWILSRSRLIHSKVKITFTLNVST